MPLDPRRAIHVDAEIGGHVFGMSGTPMIRNIATVMRGTIFAQGIGFVALPLLTRLFEPTAFGHYQLFISLLTVVLVLPTLRYEVALLRADDDQEYSALVSLCLVLCFTVTLATCAVFSIFWAIGWPEQIAKLPFAPWVLMLAMLVGGVGQFVTIIGTREKAFGAIANSKVLQSVAYVTAGLLIGYALSSDLGLVAADIVGRIALLLFLGWWALHSLPQLFRRPSFAAMRAIAHRYREYPYISTPGTLINVLGGIATPIMIYASFSAAASGQYGLLERAVGLPISLIVISVAQVFIAQFSERLRTDRESALAQFKRILKFMSALALLPLTVLVLAGPFLFQTAFGEEWRVAGELSRLMAPAYASSMLSGPIHMVLTVLGFQKLQTAWEVSRLALVVALWIWADHASIGLSHAVGLYSIVIVICNLAFVALAYLCIRYVNKRDQALGARIAQ